MKVRIIVKCAHCDRELANYSREFDFKMSFNSIICEECFMSENIIEVIK